MKRSVPAILTVTLAVSPPVSAGEFRELPLAELPAAILESAREAAPTATFVRANTETEDDGTVVYEIQGTEAEFTFDVVADDPSKIDLSALSDDGFGLQLSKVTLKDVEVEVDVFADGRVEEVERVIPARLVPGMVLKRIRDNYKGFEPSRIEASYNRHGKIFQYEFEGSAKGRSLDLEVSASGAKISEADD